MSEAKTFTGRSRRRKTHKRVIAVDRAAQALITVGGVTTIIAVLGVAFFLVWVVLPLFLPAAVDELEAAGLNRGDSGPLHFAVDEYRTLGWVLEESGEVVVFRLDTGEVRQRIRLFEGTAPSGGIGGENTLFSASFLPQDDLAVFGLADGTLRTGKFAFKSEMLDDADAPAPAGAHSAANLFNYGNGVAQRTPIGRYRYQSLGIELGESIELGSGPVRRVRHVTTTHGALIAALTEESDGLRLQALFGEQRSDFLTGKTSLVFDERAALPFEPLNKALPAYLELTGSGSDVLVGWTSGELLRVHLESTGEAFVAERGRLVDEGTRLSAMAFLLGNRTLVWGESTGAVHAGFLIRTDDYDGAPIAGLESDPRATSRLIETKRLAAGAEGAPAVSALAPSARSRLLFMGFADGGVRLVNVTNATELAAFELGSHAPVTRLVMTPKQDGLAALSGGSCYLGGFDPGHPEASFKALFRPVWYEGYSEPRHLWQSSGGSDDFEPKLGVYPLIFGTVKATFYSMLFGAPLALLAALYTSEFLNARTKSVVKPTIELMASLPSVVLGFLAALVFAPFVEDVLGATLALFLTLPLVFLAAAYTWQLLPTDVTLRYGRWRFAAITAVMPIGVALAFVLGPALEGLFFAGDLKAWLAWNPGSTGAERFADSTGGWMLLFVPASALAVVWLAGRFLTPALHRHSRRWSRRELAGAEAAKFVLGTVAILCLAWTASALCNALGLDPRGSFVDVYVQRNALVVGFVMGFAVIPIIYTLAEDALSAVPGHLRSASLGAGATPWQTAVRIVVPTAASGLFSAVMVGLGRAVGETMIVLMAAGNTPILEWNVFEGFRTLSANIAVELPEAVKDSTHYRTLFLAALVLFVMTFVVNTVAEVVRQRFRKRAYQL